MSERPFWNARDVGLLVVALLALGAIPAATRLAPMSWVDVLEAPQWWSNTRLVGDPTCMTPLYGPDATIREHLFEPYCSFGWGARGRSDYMIARVRYRFERAAVLDLEPTSPVALEPESLARFGLPVRPPDRRTIRIDDGGQRVRTLSWWEVEARGQRLDRVDLLETRLSSGERPVHARIYVNRYAYDTTHLRDEVDHAELGLALPEGVARSTLDRPHVWLSAREVGVRPGEDPTGDESSWPSVGLDAPELGEALAAHLERPDAAQHRERQLLVYASRSLPMGRVRALLERAREVGFSSAALMALREEEGGSGRQGEWLGASAPTGQLRFSSLEPNYTLQLGTRGFTVGRHTAAGMRRIPPLSGCPPQGPTVCLKPGTWEPELAFAEAARHDDAGRLGEGARALDEGLARYDFLSLYLLFEVLGEEIKRANGQVTIEAHHDVPVALFVRALSVVKYARGPRQPAGSQSKVPCVRRPRDERELWGFVPCEENTREISVHVALP